MLLPETVVKQMANKEYESYRQDWTDRLRGRILTPDRLRVTCAGLFFFIRKTGRIMNA